MAEAYFDWLVHLAAAPGKQSQLWQKALRKWMRLGRYMASCAVSGGKGECCIEPLPHDKRFAGEAWKSWPYNAFQQAFLLQQQWWHNATTGVRGVTPQHERQVEFATRQESRRRRRPKTDRIDGEALVRALLAYKRGEPRVCAMLRAPTPEDEDRRRLCRERKTLTVERIQHVNRIKGLLFFQGVSGYEPLRRNRRQRLDELKTGDGRPLPPHLKGQIGRELDQLELLLGQIKAVEAERDALLTPATETEGMSAPQAMLFHLRGIGAEFAAVVWSEGLCRSFANRRQIAAYGGLAPTPWQSGSVAREQGVSKAGNPRLGTR